MYNTCMHTNGRRDYLVRLLIYIKRIDVNSRYIVFGDRRIIEIVFINRIHRLSRRAFSLAFLPFATFEKYLFVAFIRIVKRFDNVKLNEKREMPLRL